MPSASQSCTYDGTLTPPATIPTKTGYTFKGWTVRGLPDGYTKLEYIGTNHNAYIMTDLKANDFDRVTATIMLYDYETEVASRGYPHLFGVATADSATTNGKVFRFFNKNTETMLAVYRNTLSAEWTLPSTGKNVPLNVWNNFDVKLVNGEQYIKMNTEIMAQGTVSGTLSNSYDVPIFAMSYAGDVKYKPHLDSKTITFYLGNNIVRKFIPARRNSDNVVGMYDTVTKTFFTNAGTGTFTAGPVVQ